MYTNSDYTGVRTNASTSHGRDVLKLKYWDKLCVFAYFLFSLIASSIIMPRQNFPEKCCIMLGS